MTGIITSIIISIIFGIGQATCPAGYTPYIVVEVEENQVPGYEPYYTVYGVNESGQIECILDDMTEEWTEKVGTLAYIYTADGYTTDIIPQD